MNEHASTPVQAIERRFQGTPFFGFVDRSQTKPIGRLVTFPGAIGAERVHPLQSQSGLPHPTETLTSASEGKLCVTSKYFVGEHILVYFFGTLAFAGRSSEGV